MKRGEMWTVAGGQGLRRQVAAGRDLAGRSVRCDRIRRRLRFHDESTDAPLFRLAVEPRETNGLRVSGRLMVDKITTVSRAKIGTHLGRLEDQDMLRLNRAVLVFLGIAGATVRG